MTTLLKSAVSRPVQMDAASSPVLDLVHLSLQSLGDRGLETELLRLFDRQCRQVIDRLAAEAGRGERRWLGDLAHTLKGSARAVGAHRVAAAAQNYETALTTAGEGELALSLQALTVSVAEARAAIGDLLQDA